MKAILPQKLPNMYEYFLEKGIHLEFNEIRHWVDKKIVKGYRRVFFVNTFTEPCECLITAKGILEVQLYYAKLYLSNVSWFYVDIPKSQHRWITNYEIIVQKDNKVLWTKTVKPSGEFENLI